MVLFLRAPARLILIALAFAVFASAAPRAALGQAATISDFRVLFDDRKRGERLTVSNRQNSAQRFRLEFTEFGMNEQGALTPATPETATWATARDLIRFSPRGEFVLQPGETQQVRLALRKPSGLPRGEYRSHLRVRALGAVSTAPSGFGLQPLISLTIPVVVRHNTAPAQADIAAIAPAPTQPAVSVLLRRAGEESLYGEVRLRVAGSNDAIGLVRNVSVYTTTPQRWVDVPLNDGVSLSGLIGQTITVEFFDDDRKQVVANRTLTLTGR